MKKFNFLCLLMMLFCTIGMKAADVKELVFSNVSLAPGAKVDTLKENQQITFNTNMDAEIGYMYAEIQDVTDENNKQSVLGRTTVYDPLFDNTGDHPHDGVGAPQNFKDPHFTFVCPAATVLTEGHTYAIVFKAFTDKAASTGKESPLAEGSIQYLGSTPAYVGSSIKLLSITPDPETFVISDVENRSVTLNFSGKVRMDEKGTFINTGMGSSAAFESITPGEDAEKVGDYTFSTSWTLTPKASTISDGNDVIFAANAFDVDGLHVCEGTKYSTGDDASSYYTFTVANDLGKDKFTITTDTKASELQSLGSFVVGFEEGISVAGVVEPAVLYSVAADGTKTEVAQIKWNVDLEETGFDEVSKTVRLFLDTPITKAGNYVLHFPRGYFNFGSGMTAGSSAATDVAYTLKWDAETPKISFTPSDEVTKLSTIVMDHTGTVAFNEDVEDFPVYVFNESKELVTKGALGYGDGWTDFKVELQESITTPGKYTMVVPEGYYNVDKRGALARPTRGGGSVSDGDDDEPEIFYNPEIIHEFTVAAGDISNIKVVSSIENKAIVASLESIDLTFEGAETVAQGTGMIWFRAPNADQNKENPYYDANYTGKKVTMTSTVAVNGTTVTLVPWNGSSKANKAKYGIKDACQVILNIPAGAFVVNGVEYPEINMIFTVDPTATGINNVNATDATAAKQVYTLTGIKVNGKNAKNGIFIVNGKKVVLK